uniref:SbsA Ig-like domain-containing protein n=1 Tax=candidate division WOR-3 bacterium TaxID=2052148 RepID=A0A7C4XFF9_UNCW3
MKKIIYLTLSLLLVIACQKAENILSPNPDLPQGTGAGNLPWVTSIDPGNYEEMEDQDASKDGIQGLITVKFSDYMDPATLTKDNVIILDARTNTTLSGNLITTEYYPEIRTWYISISDVPDSGSFLLRLVSGANGIRNTYGSPLDGDEDNFADGTPYDDYHSVFWTEPLYDTLITTFQPYISSFSPDTVAINDTQPYIQIGFPVTTPMDTLTLNTSNIKLAEEGGSSVTLNLISRNFYGVILQPAGPLTTAKNYTITVVCKNIKRLGDSKTPDYLLVLDGDNDGPEESEPDLQSYFRIDNPNNPPKVQSLNAIGTSGVKITFTKLIDDATITANNIMVYDNSGYVPGDLRVYTNYNGDKTIIDYYFKRTIGSGKKAFVSKEVKATNGYKLDGNGNGIGGEQWDDYRNSF